MYLKFLESLNHFVFPNMGNKSLKQTEAKKMDYEAGELSQTTLNLLLKKTKFNEENIKKAHSKFIVST